MSLDVIELNRLLRILYADEKQQTRLLKEDIRSEKRKNIIGSSGDAGHFYVPFWADAKKHVGGRGDLSTLTEDRIIKNARNKRLYTIMLNCFNLWWEQQLRATNHPIRPLNDSPKGQYTIDNVGTVRAGNMIVLNVGINGRSVIYPYFAETPVIPPEAIRVGLWVLAKCIRNYSLEDFRIYDAVRGTIWSNAQVPLKGDEADLLKRKYIDLKRKREDLGR